MFLVINTMNHRVLSRLNQLSTKINAVITPRCFESSTKSDLVSTSTALRTVMIRYGARPNVSSYSRSA